jgi:hypothetical protein
LGSGGVMNINKKELEEIRDELTAAFLDRLHELAGEDRWANFVKANPDEMPEDLKELARGDAELYVYVIQFAKIRKQLQKFR